MKKPTTYKKAVLWFISVIMITVLFSSFSNLKKKECNPLILLDEAIKKIKKFTLIKDYPFNFKEKKKKEGAEYLNQMITLSRGVRYKFLAVANKDFEGKPIIGIYMNEKMQNIIATSYNFSTKTHYEEIEFECKTTGNYWIAFSFQDGLEGCAVGVHSFLKN